MNKLCLQIATLSVFFGMPFFVCAQEEAAAPAANPLEKGIAGEKAPELIVEEWIQLPDGKESLSIKDFEGKVLVMLFFQSTSKGSHDVAFPRLQELVKHYSGNDKVKFLAVQTAFSSLLDNTAQQLKPTADKFGLKIPFGHYTYTASYPGMGGLRGTYKSPHVPWFVVIGPDGEVKYNGTQISVEMSIVNIDEMIK
ncbi:MAG: hypothetical protein P1V20_18270 [Verrucomicrobiales bacterium]|nr:hypothetical protein [Verrucomicrobiales bacterium]